MATQERTTNQTAVKTYVPADQRDAWDEHAEEMDMSRSEFVRTMVQAGRRGFDPRGYGSETADDGTAREAGGDRSPTDPDNATGADEFDERILELLDDAGCLSWSELFEALTDDVETRLDDALGRLQAENEIRHSGRDGGYVRHE